MGGVYVVRVHSLPWLILWKKMIYIKVQVSPIITYLILTWAGFCIYIYTSVYIFITMEFNKGIIGE